MCRDNANDLALDEDSESSRGTGAQAFALSARRHPDVRALVCGLSAESSTPGRDDGGARNFGRPFDRAPLGHQGVASLEKAFRRHKKAVGRSWRMDETYIKVRGQWKFLYRAVDKEGNTVDFLLCAHRDKAAARRYFEKSIDQNGEPETVTIDKSGANRAALDALNAERKTPIAIRQNKYLNNVIEQDHRAIKRRTRSMLGFKSFRCARILLSGIELMHMIGKDQMEDGGFGSTHAQQFYSLAV
jgi:putative transposase